MRRLQPGRAPPFTGATCASGTLLTKINTGARATACQADQARLRAIMM